MKNIIRLLILGILLVLPKSLWANPELVVFKSPLVWSYDGSGDYLFEENGQLNGCQIAEDGAVEYVSSPGTYEITSPYMADGSVFRVAADWTFSGEVTLEVSTSGDSAGYMPLTCGVPYEWEILAGNQLKWRATLGPGSRLEAVRITYKDITGTLGSFGNPKLSGLNFRKPVVIASEAKDSLFNYQIPIKVGESQKAEDPDFYLKGVVQSDFSDLRFTQADQETSLPHYLESISGDKPNRTALFWLKIPQIPKGGLVSYLYYGKSGAEDLSAGDAVFAFFDDFQSETFDNEKWSAYAFSEGILEYKLESEPEVKEYVIASEATQSPNQEIIDFFKSGQGFAWARVRKAADTSPGVDKTQTQGVAEEVPNLPDFSGTDIAGNGDLVLAQGASEGEYLSYSIFPEFTARIMVPNWEEVIPPESELNIDISAEDQTDFKRDCQKESYYYASKEDFTAGENVKWRVRLSRDEESGESASLSRFSVDFRPGTISLMAPDGGERLTPGGRYNITWSALEYEPSYPMRLAYSKDGGKTYLAVINSVNNVGKYSWRLPKITTSKALVRIYDGFDALIYDTSNRYFGIGAAASGAVPASLRGSEATEAISEEEILGDKTAAEGAKLYDILIKLGDNRAKNPVEDARASYKDGDIVLVMPAGHEWSETEKKSFLIVQANLTPEEAAKLMQPRERKGTVVGRRKYKINLIKQGLFDEKVRAMKGLLKSQIFLDVDTAVESKDGS